MFINTTDWKKDAVSSRAYAPAMIVRFTYISVYFFKSIFSVSLSVFCFVIVVIVPEINNDRTEPLQAVTWRTQKSSEAIKCNHRFTFFFF